jgi:hypothetical protein
MEGSESVSMHRLTVSLLNMGVPTRRQVEVPSDLTLAGLHEVIGVLFDWDGDHLYEFTVGLRRYGHPALDTCHDDDVPLAAVANRPGKVIKYTYDLGECWEHRIMVDAVEPAEPGLRHPRCLASVAPHPAEYDGDLARPLDLAALDKRLADIPLRRNASAGPSPVAGVAEVSALVVDACRVPLLQDLVNLGRWAVTPRAVTAAGVLKKQEVPGALEILRISPPPAAFHSARNLPQLDVAWRLAEALGLIDVSAQTVVAGPGLGALTDEAQILDLWTDLWEFAAVDGRAVWFNGRAVHPWVMSPLLWALWQADEPLAVSDIDRDAWPHRYGTEYPAAVFDQLVPLGGVRRRGDRYQLSPLGRHAHRTVLGTDPTATRDW